MGASSLFRVDSITVDGKALAIVDGSATLNGFAGMEATPVPSASGPDFESYARVPRTIDASLQFGPTVQPSDLSKIRNARIVMTDKNGPRRVMCPNCSFASMGALGKGAVDLKFNVLEEPIWM